MISDRRLVGGLVLGHHPEDFSAILAAVKKGTYMGDASLAALRGGDLSVLNAGSRAQVGCAPTFKDRHGRWRWCRPS